MKDSSGKAPQATVSGAIAGVLLASGMSRRFGQTNKLLLSVGGVPLVRRTTETYLAAGLAPVIVVVGHDAPSVRAALAGLPLVLVDNPDYREGQSRALVRGVARLPATAVAAVIGVADQPGLRRDVIGQVIDRFQRTGATAVVPRYDGRRGNPVLFAREHFPDLQRVTGDEGGRQVLACLDSRVEWVDVVDEKAGYDIDTPEDWRAWHSEHERGGQTR